MDQIRIEELQVFAHHGYTRKKMKRDRISISMQSSIRIPERRA